VLDSPLWIFLLATFLQRHKVVHFTRQNNTALSLKRALCLRKYGAWYGSPLITTLVLSSTSDRVQDLNWPRARPLSFFLYYHNQTQLYTLKSSPRLNSLNSLQAISPIYCSDSRVWLLTRCGFWSRVEITSRRPLKGFGIGLPWWIPLQARQMPNQVYPQAQE